MIRRFLANWPLYFILSLHFFFLFFFSFTAWPEMLTWPYLILKGFLPYKDIAIVHTPLLLFDLTIFYKIFGVGGLQLKLYTWILIFLTDVALYWISLKLWGKKVALVSLVVYLILQVFYEGNGLWFDLGLAPLALLAYYTLKQRRYLLTGILWGLAFLTKQTAAWFLFPIFFTLLQKIEKNTMKKLGLGVLVVFGVSFAILYVLGIWKDFLFWGLEFGVLTLPQAQGQVHLPAVRQLILSLSPFIVFIPLLLKRERKYLVLFTWAFFGILGALPRFELFHFQPGLPFLSIAGGLVLTGVRKTGLAALVRPLFLIVLLFMLVRSLVVYWGQPDRFLEPSVIKTAEYIRENTAPDEKIFVLNTWDSFYALADRLPAAKPWYPQLAWYYQIEDVEQAVAGDLMANPPSLVVFQRYTEEGLSSFKPEKVADFIFKYFEETASIEDTFLILSPNK